MDYFDLAGAPITFQEWAAKKEDTWEIGEVTWDYSRVGLDDVAGINVSTVWLGMEHGRDDHGRPMIFETMVFGGPWDSMCCRYATLTEAAVGHLTVVDRLQRGLSPWEDDDE